jgi:nicotinamide-nucleotide amidase
VIKIKRAVLIALGDELLSGIRKEGNCSWLANKLSRAGWKVECIEIIPDGNNSLTPFLEKWIGKTGLLVLSGGLGPTHDDCTRRAIAQFLGTELVPADEAYDKILSRYPEEMQKALEKSRDTQGVIPARTRPVHNPAGSALGVAFEEAGTIVRAFPGVPSEFRAMAEQELEQEMRPNSGIASSILIAGWAESLLKDRLAPVIERPELHITILPSPGLIEFYIRGAPEDVARAERDVKDLVPGDYLPSAAKSLADAVISGAKQKNISLACAESCTGGMVGGALTSIPGSSEVFFGSAVCYSNTAKKSILSVNEITLDQEGAVSSLCAAEMALGALKIYGSDLAVSVTGIAGPDGGTDEKPVGTVWFGLADKGGVETVKRVFPGDRDIVRERAKNFALDRLWRKITEKDR